MNINTNENKKRVRKMVTVLRTYTDISYQEAVRELLAMEDSRATINRTNFGYKIGYMAWRYGGDNRQEKHVPIYTPTTSHGMLTEQ